MSACLAAILSVRCSPPPPTRIGGPPGLDRLRDVEDAWSILVVAALERRPVLGEHRLRDRQRLVEAVHPLADRREVEPEAVVLGLEPRRAEAEDRAAAGDHVERGDRLREQAPGCGRSPRSRACRGGRVFVSRARAAERRPGLEHRFVLLPDARDLVEVVHDGDHAEAGGLGRLGLLDDRDRTAAPAVGRGRCSWEGGDRTRSCSCDQHAPDRSRPRVPRPCRLAPPPAQVQPGSISTQTSGCPDPAWPNRGGGCEVGAGGPADGQEAAAAVSPLSSARRVGLSWTAHELPSGSSKKMKAFHSPPLPSAHPSGPT